MEEFIGIFFLFVASLELLLLVNALIFSQKNKINIIIFIIIAIYAANHLFEFLICQFDFNDAIILFLNFSLISFLPSLSLLLALKFWHHETLLKYIIFLPVLFLIYYFTNSVYAFSATECSFLFVTYSYPLRSELGIFYFLLNTAALLFLLVKLKNPKLRYKKHLNWILIISISVSIILPFIIILLIPSINKYAESILNKFAFFYVIGLTYFSLKNKTEYLSEKG